MPYFDGFQPLQEESWYLLPQPLVPGAVRGHALSGGREVKVPLYDEPEAIATQGEERKDLLLTQVLQKRWQQDDNADNNESNDSNTNNKMMIIAATNILTAGAGHTSNKAGTTSNRQQ